MLPLGIEGHIGDLTEQAVDSRQRRIGMLERMSELIRRFRLAAQHHHRAPCGGELDHHVGAFVGDPDIVLRINADRVGIAPGVQVLADLADVVAVRSELEQLGGTRAIGGTIGAAAMEDEDVAARIDGDARDFAEMQVVRHLEEIHVRVERDRGRIFRRDDGGGRKQQQRDETEFFHETLLRLHAPNEARALCKA